MLGQGAQTSSAVLSAAVLVLTGVDMGSKFLPPFKIGSQGISHRYLTERFMGSLLKFVWPPLCLPEISWTCSPGCQSASKALACQFPWPLIKVQGYWWKSHQFAWFARYSGCSGPCQGHKKDFSVSGRTSLTFVSASTGTVMGRLVLFRASIYPPPLTDSDTGGHLARRGVITEPGKPDYGPRQSYNYTLVHFSSTIFSEWNSGYLEC